MFYPWSNLLSANITIQALFLLFFVRRMNESKFEKIKGEHIPSLKKKSLMKKKSKIYVFSCFISHESMSFFNFFF